MRGEVYALRPPKNARGHEQQGRRYAVILQASRFAHLSTWLAIPTSTSAHPYVFRPEVEEPGKGTALALCEGLVAIDPQLRLAESLGSLTYAEMQEIDQALTLLMDL
jgi:mRNA interferase MazF